MNAALAELQRGNFLNVPVLHSVSDISIQCNLNIRVSFITFFISVYNLLNLKYNLLLTLLQTFNYQPHQPYLTAPCRPT
jgi:hypothetical protein